MATVHMTSHPINNSRLIVRKAEIEAEYTLNKRPIIPSAKRIFSCHFSNVNRDQVVLLPLKLLCYAKETRSPNLNPLKPK